MIETTAIKQLPETRRKILEILKRKGPMTADELGRDLGITSMGVRQHLVALERDSLIEYETKQRGMGRPSYVYALTSAGGELFPRSYPQLLLSFLEAAQQAYGESGLKKVFLKRNEALELVYQTRLAGKDLAGKVAELADIRCEEGYMAIWERQDERTFLLLENNCAICQVAQKCLQVCDFELELFKSVLPEAEISRKNHIMNGDLHCAYVIKQKL